MKKLIIFIVINCLGILLSGCVTQNLSPTNRTSLHTVNVDPNVNMPKNLLYYSQGKSLGMAVGGALGVLVDAAVDGSDEEKINKSLVDNNIRVDRILLNEFTSQLKKRDLFAVVSDHQPADATFKIKVSSYGLYHQVSLSNKLSVGMKVDVSLINNSGTVIWRDAEAINLFSNSTPAYTVNQYLNNPSLLKNEFTAACSIISNKLLDNLLNQ